MADLTPKQEKFAQLYVETGNASDAYRQAYDASRMKPESVHRTAKEMLDTPKVSSRIAELREGVKERNRLTLDDLIAELEEARTIALSAETPQSGAAVSATMGKAKILGLDKQVVQHIGDSNNPLTHVVLGPDDYKAARKAMLGEDDV